MPDFNPYYNSYGAYQTAPVSQTPTDNPYGTPVNLGGYQNQAGVSGELQTPQGSSTTPNFSGGQKPGMKLSSGQIGGIMNGANALYGDIKTLDAPRQHVAYGANPYNMKPSFDTNSYYQNWKTMDKQSKNAMPIAGNTAKYAAIGAQIGGPWGALAGGAVGLGMGIAKYVKGRNDAKIYHNELNQKNQQFNSDLNTYNVNQNQQDVMNQKQQQYATRNPYSQQSLY